ncbi:MAG TPA: hypothetical protein H9827_02325 [Candidatus Luteimonas excrementigallinarum]|nr:hypothetical protein [Candidatus Luteimonas excrementigallinarum]
MDLHGVLEQLFADYPQADWRSKVTYRPPERAITTQHRENDGEFATAELFHHGS